MVLISVFLGQSLASAYELASPDEYWSQSQEFRYNKLILEFRSYANYYVSTRGYRFGSGAQSIFNNQFPIKAANAVMQKTPKNHESARRKIRENVRKIIDQMILETQGIPGYKKRNPGVIGEQTFSRAMMAICPLWPFCD